jgi:glycerol uptake facilitator-like aquaporin
MGPEPRGAQDIGAAGAPARPASPDAVMRLIAEAMGSGLLTFLIVAAGLLAERHAGESIALAALITALAGAAGFLVLARAMSPWPLIGFNPALALALIVSGRLDLMTGLLSAAVQIAAAFLGVMLAHLVSNTGLVQVATQIETGAGVWTGEFLGTGLFVFAMLSLKARGQDALIPLTGALALLVIALATPSLSFANPALTLARALTDSFTAIRLIDAAAIAGVQCLAALGAWLMCLWLSPGGEG